MRAARAALLLVAIALASPCCAPTAEPPAPHAPIAAPAGAPAARDEAAPLPTQAPAPRAQAPAPSAEDPLASRMIARVNLYRSRQGLAPLRPDAALARAAEAHARDMAEHANFTHVGSDGAALGARASRAGYRWQRIAENIAGGQASPEAVVDDWMASEGHRANILEPAYRDAGVGHVVRDPDRGRLRYRHYWVLILGEQSEH